MPLQLWIINISPMALHEKNLVENSFGIGLVSKDVSKQEPHGDVRKCLDYSRELMLYLA